MKILYVEDEIPHVELTRRTLEDNLKKDFVLLHAESYKDATELLSEESNIDIVLSDLRLPDGSGLDLLKQIRELKLPPAVVLVTGQGDEQVAVAALKAGAADYIVKQTDYLNRLPIVITNAVAQHKLEQEQAAKLEAEVRYQTLVEQTPAVVFLDDAENHEVAIYTSPRIEELTGFTVEEWNADSFMWEDYLHPEDKERISEANNISQQNGSRFEEEYRYIRKDGEIIWIKEETHLIRDKEGNPLYWQGIMIDITRDKETAAALERQLKELTVLNAVTLAGAEGASEDEIIERIVNLTALIFNEVNGVLLLNQEGDILTPHPSYLGASVDNWQEGIPVSQGITGRSVLTDKIIRLGNVSEDSSFIEITTDIRSELCVPIRANKRIIGVFNVESSRLNAYDREDEQFLTTVAGSLGTALERLRFFKREQQRNRELNTLYETTRSLAQSLSPETIAQNLLDVMAAQVGHDISAVVLLDESGQFLLPLAIKFKVFTEKELNEEMERLRNLKIRADQGVVGWVIKNNTGISIGDVRNDPRYYTVQEGMLSLLCAPINVRGKVIGALILESPELNAYNQNDENLLKSLAGSTAIAFENAGLYQDALKASERRAVLHSISQDIVRFTQDQEQIYTSIHKAAENLMPCDVFMITLQNDSDDESIFVYTVEGNTRNELKNEPTSDGLSGMVVNLGKSIIFENEQDIETKGFPRFGSEKRVNSVVAVPMRAGDRIIGMISAQSYQPYSYGSEEQSLLEMLATHAATAIENTRLYNETQQRLKELETINKLSSSMHTTQSQTEMCRILLDETLDLLKADNGSVWVYKSSTNMLVQRAAKGMAAKVAYKRLKPNEGIVGHVFSKEDYYVSTDMRNDQLLYKSNRNAFPEGFDGVGIPIYSTDGIMGVLMVEIESSQQIEKHVDLLKTLAGIAGNAIHRADLFDQSQDQIRKLTTLRDIDSAIASSTDLNVTLNILMDHTLRHLNVDAVDIQLYHPELQSLSHLCSTGFKTPSPSRPLVRVGEGLAGQAVMKARIVQIPDLRETTEVTHDPLLLREGFISYIGVPLIVKGQIKGLFEIFNRAQISPDHEWMQFMQTLTGQAAIAIDNSQLFENLQRSNQEIRQAYDTTLEGWAKALELRDRETEGHTRRVTELTMRLAYYMNISEDEMININRGVLLHDIGKMGVPDQILRKTGPLTDSEWLEMRKHPQYAFDLLSPIPYLRPALDIPYCHHEHWDGSGYPRGLKGTQIPLSARIFSVVDIWDALLSDRTYRKAWPRDKVLEYLKDVSGTILDPDIVEMFLKMLSEDESL
ncbi:MAG TPA: GAF domain-containing protein [Anaerolineales bacterium]|nr:GAF domain-containing protein [Anaerolineales bacterium]